MIKMNWPTYAWKIFCNWGKVIDVRTSPKVGLWRTFVIVSDFQDVQVLFDHKPVIVLPLFKFMQRSCSINEEKCRHYPKKGHAKITKVLISYRHSLSRKFDNMESNGFDIEQYWTVGLSWATRRWNIIVEFTVLASLGIVNESIWRLFVHVAYVQPTGGGSLTT